MKPVIFVCCAVVFYSISNIVIERKLASVPTVSLLLCSFPLMWMLAFVQAGNMKMSGKALDMPFNTIFCFVALNAILWFLADYCYISAYNSGGSAITITTIVVMIPAIIMVLKYFCFGNVPNIYHMLGWGAGRSSNFLCNKGGDG